MKKKATILILTLAAVLLCATAIAVSLRFILPDADPAAGYPCLQSFYQRIDAEAARQPDSDSTITVADPEYLCVFVKDGADVSDELLAVPEEILSAPTRELLEYFMNSDFMKNRAASETLKSAPRETDDMDYSCHRAFCELISRADFVECLEDYARSLPEDCSINYFSSPGTALAKVLKQPSVKKIVDEAISAAA